MKLIDETVKELKGFYTQEYFACTKCGHAKDSHYWNGGGRPECSGYDSCHVCDCELMSEDEVIKEDVCEEVKQALRTALEAVEKQAREDERRKASQKVWALYWDLIPDSEIDAKFAKKESK